MSSYAQEKIEFGKIYSVHLEIFSNDSVVVRSFIVTTGTPSYFTSQDTGYVAQIISRDGKELFSGNIIVSFGVIVEPSDFNLISDRVVLDLRIPASSDAARLRILHEGKTLVDAGVPSEAQIFNLLYFILGVVLIVGGVIAFFLIRKRVMSSNYENLKRKWQ